MRFLLGEMTPAQDFPRIFSVSAANNIPPSFHTHLSSCDNTDHAAHRHFLGLKLRGFILSILRQRTSGIYKIHVISKQDELLAVSEHVLRTMDAVMQWHSGAFLSLERTD